MRCPFCDNNKIEVVKEDLIVADDKDAFEGRTTPNGHVYDEGIYHYECENKHVFFGCSQERVDDDAEQQRTRDVL